MRDPIGDIKAEDDHLEVCSSLFKDHLNSKVPLGNPILDIMYYLRKQSFIGSVASQTGHFQTLIVYGNDWKTPCPDKNTEKKINSTFVENKLKLELFA